MSTTDIVSIVNSMNQEQKYNLLKCHFVLSDIFHFPRNIVQAVIGAFQDGMYCVMGCARDVMWCKSVISAVGSN